MLTWTPTFLVEWAKTSGPWVGMTKTWLATATPQELYHVAGFHIPEPLVAAIPEDEMPDFRCSVAWHLY